MIKPKICLVLILIIVAVCADDVNNKVKRQSAEFNTENDSNENTMQAAQTARDYVSMDDGGAEAAAQQGNGVSMSMSMDQQQGGMGMPMGNGFGGAGGNFGMVGGTGGGGFMGAPFLVGGPTVVGVVRPRFFRHPHHMHPLGRVVFVEQFPHRHHFGFKKREAEETKSKRAVVLEKVVPVSATAAVVEPVGIVERRLHDVAVPVRERIVEKVVVKRETEQKTENNNRVDKRAVVIEKVVPVRERIVEKVVEPIGPLGAPVVTTVVERRIHELPIRERVHHDVVVVKRETETNETAPSHVDKRAIVGFIEEPFHHHHHHHHFQEVLLIKREANETTTTNSTTSTATTGNETHTEHHTEPLNKRQIFLGAAVPLVSARSHAIIDPRISGFNSNKGIAIFSVEPPPTIIHSLDELNSLRAPPPPLPQAAPSSAQPPVIKKRQTEKTSKTDSVEKRAAVVVEKVIPVAPVVAGVVEPVGIVERRMHDVVVPVRDRIVVPLGPISPVVVPAPAPFVERVRVAKPLIRVLKKRVAEENEKSDIHAPVINKRLAMSTDLQTGKESLNIIQ